MIKKCEKFINIDKAAAKKKKIFSNEYDIKYRYYRNIEFLIHIFFKKYTVCQ